MLEEALVVLTDGLKTHPGFVRARVVLGRVYLDKGQFREAKEQFETVINESPDNLLAHRKLVKIYREERDFQKAIQSCRVVLNENPKDEEMRRDLMDLEARQNNAGTVVKSRPEVSGTQPADPVKDVSSSAPEDPASALELNFPSSERGAAATKPLEGETGNTIELKEEDTSFEEIMGLMGQEAKIEKAAPAAKATEEDLATESLAELYINQGFYDKGIEIYKALLLKDPENDVLLKKLKDAGTRSKSVSRVPADPVKAEMPASGHPASSKGETAAINEVGAERVHEPPVPSAPLPGQQSKAEKIQKLQAWLEQIKRSQK